MSLWTFITILYVYILCSLCGGIHISRSTAFECTSEPFMGVGWVKEMAMASGVTENQTQIAV